MSVPRRSGAHAGDGRVTRDETSGPSPGDQDGVLPRQAIRALIDEGSIALARGDSPTDNLQPASLDLTLGDVAYRLRCSFLPGNRPVAEKLTEYAMGELDLASRRGPRAERPYLIPLSERLRLPKASAAGRIPEARRVELDVFTRVDHRLGQHFDEIPDGYEGALVPRGGPRCRSRSGSGRARAEPAAPESGQRPADRRAADRARKTDPSSTRRLSQPGDRAVVSDGLFLSVDLSGGPSAFVGYRAKKSSALLEPRTGQRLRGRRLLGAGPEPKTGA